MRHLLGKYIPTVTALDTILGSFGGTLGYAICRQGTPSGRRRASCKVLIPQSVNGRRYCSVWTVPLKMH